MKDTRNTWQHPIDWVLAVGFVATLVALVFGWI
jgi:hypothetical protein